MQWEESVLVREVNAVLQDGPKNTGRVVMASIFVIPENTYYQSQKVISIDRSRNYTTNFMDEVMVSMVFTGGVYLKHIYANQPQLEGVLTEYTLQEGTEYPDLSIPPKVTRYTAYLQSGGNPIIEGGDGTPPTEDVLDLANLVGATFHMVDKTQERLRTIQIGKTLRGQTVEEALKYLLWTESTYMAQPDDRSVLGVDMIPASNKDVRDHIVIPPGTNLVDVPGYIQQECGVYSSGMGYYFQDGYWYLYPRFDTTRTNNTDRSITLVVIPQNRLPGLERTYKQLGDSLTVLVTGEISFRDNHEQNQVAQGNGIRFADANKLMSGFVATKDNTTTASRGGVMKEFVTTKNKRDQNFAPMTPDRITANPYQEFSRLAARDGGSLTLVWENSVPELILPGMLAIIKYLDQDVVKEIRGVVNAAAHYTSLYGIGMTSNRHVTQTTLGLFVREA